MKSSKRKSNYRNLKKNKYNLILILIIALICFFLFSKLVDGVESIFFSNSNKDVLVIKEEDNEVKSFSIKEIKKLKQVKKNIKLNKHENINVKGVYLLDILQKTSVELTKYTYLYVVDMNNDIKKLHMSSVLEPERMILKYDASKKTDKESIYTLIDTKDGSLGNRIININSLELR